MNDEPTHLDLFSGIGGFTLAARWAGFHTVGFSEVDPAACEILRRRWPAIPNFGNIFKLDGTKFSGVSLITGGFPCQPFSVAGKRRGKEDDRHLWPEMLRVISEARPDWVVGENVAGIVAMELDNVLSDLEGIGYQCQPLVVPAVAVDAKHRRDRVWIIANAMHNRCLRDGTAAGIYAREKSENSQQQRSGGPSGSERRCGFVADANSRRRERPSELQEEQSVSDAAKRSETALPERIIIANAGYANCEEQRIPEPFQPEHASLGCCCRWESEPGMGRVAHGIPNRAHRLKGLGNAIVPQVAFEILRGIRGLT